MSPAPWQDTQRASRMGRTSVAYDGSVGTGGSGVELHPASGAARQMATMKMKVGARMSTKGVGDPAVHDLQLALGQRGRRWRRHDAVLFIEVNALLDDVR